MDVSSLLCKRLPGRVSLWRPAEAHVHHDSHRGRPMDGGQDALEAGHGRGWSERGMARESMLKLEEAD